MEILQEEINRIKRIIDDKLEKTRKTRLQFDEPENLTQEEIDKILVKMPRVNSIDHELADKTREYILNILSYMLKLPSNKIIKSAIPELTRILINTFNRAKAEPGMPVGLLAAQAISSQLMQATLNTFHYSGSKKNVESGIKAYEDMLKVRSNISSPSCDIYFKDKVTFNDIIYEKRPKLVQTLVDDLIISSDILNKSELYNENGLRYPHYTLYENMNSTQSFSLLRHIKVPDLEDPTDRSGMTFLRLTLDTDKLYKYQITSGDVCYAIMKLDNNSTKIVCVPSPIIMRQMTDEKIFTVDNVSERHSITKYVPFSYIDIFTFVENVKREIIDEFNADVEKISNDNINQAYFNTIVIPGFAKIIVKGVTDLTNIYPEKTSVWSVIEEEIRDGKKWILRYNMRRMIKTGISVKHVVNLCVISNMVIVTSDSHHLVVKTPEIPDDAREVLNIGPNKILKWRPGQVINYIKLKELDANNEYAKTMREKRNKLMIEKKFVEAEKISTIKPASEFELSLSFMYAISDGSNLIDLLQDEDIDETRTISNNTLEILKVFGIEAARKFFTEQLHNIIRMNDNYVDTRHIMIVADHITRLGFITPFTELGMKHHPIGSLTRAAYKKPSQQLQSMAITGKRESLKSTYPAILTGRSVSLGTGIVSASMNKKKEKEFMDKFKIKEMYDMKAEDLSSVVEKMEGEVGDIMDEDYIQDNYAVINNEGIMIGTSSPPALGDAQISPSLVGSYPQSSLTQMRGFRKSPIVEQESIIIRSIPTPSTVPLPGSAPRPGPTPLPSTVPLPGVTPSTAPLPGPAPRIPEKFGVDVLPEGITIGGMEDIEAVVSFPTFTQDTGASDIMKNIISFVQTNK